MISQERGDRVDGTANGAFCADTNAVIWHPGPGATGSD